MREQDLVARKNLSGCKSGANFHRSRLPKMSRNMTCLACNNQLGLYRSETYSSLTYRNSVSLLNPLSYVQKSLSTNAIDIFRGHTELQEVSCSPNTRKLAVAFNKPLWFSYYDLKPESWLRLNSQLRSREVIAWYYGMMLCKLHFTHLSDSENEPSFVLYAWTSDMVRGTTITLRDFTLNSIPEWRTSVKKMTYLQSLVGVWRDRNPLVVAAWETVMKLPVTLYDVVGNTKRSIHALRGRSILSQLFSKVITCTVAVHRNYKCMKLSYVILTINICQHDSHCYCK